MVRFGEYILPHALILGIQESRVLIDHLIPSARVGYRDDETMGGRIITVNGEVRDADAVLRFESLRVRADNIARPLDLQDGSPLIKVRLGSVAATWTVENGPDRVHYEATFHETSGLLFRNATLASVNAATSRIPGHGVSSSNQ